MGNSFPGVAGDPNNGCTYCRLGKKWGWEGKGVFHTHDGTTPLAFQEKGNKDSIDPLTYLGADVVVGPEEIEAANNLVEQFFAGSGFNPRIHLQFDFVVTLAKVSRYRIHKPLNISDEIQLMLQHAKMGDFDGAFRILDKHQGTSMVNCIPPNRAWGLLHQAAYFNNFRAVEKILENPKCDPSLRTKIAKDGAVNPSSTSDMIAKDEKVRNIILKHQKIRSAQLKTSTNPDVYSVEFEKDISVESIIIMINTFENVLHPRGIKSEGDMVYSNLMLNVFNFINTGNNWERARKEVSLQLQSLNVFDAIFLATGKDNGQITDEVIEKKADFFSRVICLYTRECKMTAASSGNTKTFYTALNISLLKEGCVHSFVSGEDLALAAYGVLLNAILMYWGNLMPTNEPTFRRMYLSAEQISSYKEGHVLTWLCFSSSSLKQSVTESFGNVLFECDNTQITKYAAKGIKSFSQFSSEEEFLYPSGARFLIEKITKIEKTENGNKLCIRFVDY